MSLQVFLQAQLSGIEEFLGSPPSVAENQANDFIGRSAWLTLFCEVLPRALLSDLKLSSVLLGSSSAEQFLVVLAEDDIPRANQFLSATADALQELSENTLRLVWASTENLGTWQVASKRLDDALTARRSTPLAQAPVEHFFTPFKRPGAESSSYFVEFAKQLSGASRVGWSSEKPAQILCDEGQFSWKLSDQASMDEDAIFFPRRLAMNEAGTTVSSFAELATRAEGVAGWGVLRGDVDNFDARRRRANTIEEHIHLSILFKQFFAGELALLCSYPEFWRKVSVVYRGGDDFAVAGSWDSLILFARELHRLFEKFVEQNLTVSGGTEARGISMALEIAPEAEASAAAVFEQAGLHLRSAKVSEAGTFHLFGRTLEWARLQDAEDLKTGLMRLAKDFRAGRGYIDDLASVYRESFAARASRRGKAARVEKPWRTYLRISEVLPQAQGKEFNNVRNTIVTNLLGKKTAGLKLRASARVGLEWARLAAGK